MKKLHLRIAAIVAFSSLAASLGSFAAARDTHELSKVEPEQTVAPLEPHEHAVESLEMCPDESAQRVSDPFDGPNMVPLATYQDCVNTCKAGVVAIEAMCRFIPDPRAKAACFLARFSVPACIGFCGWYFGK